MTAANKVSVVFPLLWLLWSCTSADRKPTTPIHPNVASKEAPQDTLFIKREIGPNYYHAVFIEQDKQSDLYKWLTDFRFDEYDLRAFEADYEHLKGKHPQPFGKRDLGNLEREWLPVEFYKGQYYLYLKCNAAKSGRRIISDTLLYGWDMDGPYADFILKLVRKTSPVKYVLKTQSRFDLTRVDEIVVHIVDSASRMAVWEFRDANPKTATGYTCPPSMSTGSTSW